MKKTKNQRLESLPYEINLRFSEAISQGEYFKSVTI